jgi:hypothetical protein
MGAAQRMRAGQELFSLCPKSFASGRTSRRFRTTAERITAMSHRFIRYRIKPEKMEENQQLIDGVFSELHAKSPANVR